MNDSQDITCIICGDWMGQRKKNDLESGLDVCRNCQRFYPDSLIKASYDPFSYALRLNTGELIYFNSCEIHGPWVRLNLGSPHWDWSHYEPPATHLPPFDRGVDVRVSSIVWCADAPFGS